MNKYPATEEKNGCITRHSSNKYVIILLKYLPHAGIFDIHLLEEYIFRTSVN